MKKIFIILIGLSLVLVGSFLLFSSRDEAKITGQNNLNQIDSEISLADQINSKVRDNQAVLLDVRTPEEFKQGHSELAINYDSRLIDQGSLPNIDKNKEIFLYCRSGNRSTEVQKTLEANGFTNITNLGGLAEMRNIGLL